jgi:nucleoside-diphosphate-sugar epimerase
MRILVTGGSGFIGTNLVEEFIRRGDEVVNIDIAPPRNKNHLSAWKKVDILNLVELQKLILKFDPEVIVHMAARTDLAGKHQADYIANTAGVSNIITCVRQLKNHRLTIFASSMLVCRIGYKPISEDDYQPSTEYGLSKVDGELRVRQEAGKHFSWVILRPTSIWGPWFKSPYRDFFSVVEGGKYFHPLGHRIHRNYGFVLNSVYQITRIIEANGSGLVGRAVYLADYNPIELKQWACKIQEYFKSARVREIPFLFLWLAAKIGDLLTNFGIRYFPLNSFRLNNLMTDCLVDTDPIFNIAGQIPFNLNEGVVITCRWIESERRDS